MAKEQEKPEIVVDSDWKAQAQAEKERLAKEVEAPKERPGAEMPPPGVPEAGAAEAEAPHELPPASFSTLVGSIATQVLMALGGYQDPQTRRRYVDLALAKHYIDTLAVLEEKTKGNLTDEEKQLLDHAIYETRMQYVQIAQRLAQGS